MNIPGNKVFFGMPKTCRPLENYSGTFFFKTVYSAMKQVYVWKKMSRYFLPDFSSGVKKNRKHGFGEGFLPHRRTQRIHDFVAEWMFPVTFLAMHTFS